MDVGVHDKTAVITGASRGIGEAVAARFLAAGARGVVITGRKPENLQEAVERLNGGGRVAAVAARADTEEGADAAVDMAIQQFGSCDILVNNAGTNPAYGPLVETDLGALDRTWQVNLRGPLLYVRAAWSRWMGEHGGVICNNTSVGGLKPGHGLGAYNIAKAGLIFMTRQLAYEMAPKVRVVCVAPGVIKTRLSELLWKSDEQSAGNYHPMKRLGEPEDVASAVVYLCSDQASWITGVTLEVDGGLVNATGYV